MRNRNREIERPMMKKFAKMKSRRDNRLRGFLVSLDLGLEAEVEGRRELAQPPRRVLPMYDEKAIVVCFALGEMRSKGRRKRRRRTLQSVVCLLMVGGGPRRRVLSLFVVVRFWLV